MKAITSPLLDLLHRPRHVPSPSSPTLVHVKQTLLQSSNALLSELIHGTISRGERLILISSGERNPNLLYPGLAAGDRPNVTVIAVDHSLDFEDVGSSAGDGWASRLLKHLQSTPRSQPTTVIIEALDSLLDCADCADPVRQVYRDLSKAAAALGSASTLVLVSSQSQRSVSAGAQARLLSLIASGSFIQASSDDYTQAANSSAPRDASGGSASFITIQLHPPALWRYLLKEYGTGLRPASTSSEVAQRLRDMAAGSANRSDLSSRAGRRDVSSLRSKSTVPAELASIFDWDSRSTDPRLWSILDQLSASSALGEGFWFSAAANELTGDEIEAIRAVKAVTHTGAPDPVEARITLADLLGPPSGATARNEARFQDPRGETHRSRVGWGTITAQYRLPGAKFGEEVFGCVAHLEADESGGSVSRLRPVPLEMGDRRAAAVAAAATNKPGKGGADLVDSLPFKLSLTDEQKLRRDRVELPFAPTDRIYEGISLENPEMIGRSDEDMGLRRGTTGQSTIYFEPDSADEEDEEDPDEDLEI